MKTAPRRPPAFQVYASDDLAASRFYGLSLAERGLFDSIERVIWCEDSIPADIAGIALAVRRPEDEVRDALTDRLRLHFRPVEGNPSRMTCPELCRQMARLLDQRRKQSEAADKTNHAKREGKRNADRDGEGVAPELNRTEKKRTEPVYKEDPPCSACPPGETAEYVRAFDSVPEPVATTAEDYRRASRG